jgi:PAS domain S-box-containing protein
MLISLALLSALPVCAAGQSKTVLTIYSDERLLPFNQALDAALRDSLGVETHGAPTYLSEFLDFARFGNSSYDKLASDFIRGKYAGQFPDVVVAVGPLAFQFLYRHQSDLFTGIPVIVIGVGENTLKAQSLPPNFVGVPFVVEPLPTIEFALRLQPDAREIVVVTGASEFDRSWEATLRRDLPRLHTSIPIRYLSGLSLDDVLRELSHLSPNTIVFFSTFFRDGAGTVYIPARACRRMADASTAPMYGSYSTLVGVGIVGGYVLRVEEMSRQTAGLVKKIFDGEKLTQAGMPPAVPSQYVVDWKQLRRWHLSEARLPPRTIVLYREPSPWQRYKWYIIGGSSLILLETLLIVALLVQRRRRRLAEATLGESQQQMALAVNAADFGIWIRDLKRNEIWASDKWRELFGFAPSERLEFERILERLNPDDRDGFRQVLAKATGGGGRYDTEFRLILPDGGTRWISSHGLVEFDSNGRPVRTRGASRDITARKQSEQETQLLRQEIAQVDRISTMGQLASSLAHEINQPLGAILRNAEAAELFMQDASPDLDEIRAILADIRKDDERAGSVIDRMRRLLKRQDLDTRPLDVDDLVRDVVAFVRTDAATRHSKVEVAVRDDLPPVLGDRVHLQQVLLNLIINGLDALDEAIREDRRVTVSALLDGAQTVEIVVSDTGNGIPADKLAHIFDPFFTTKPKGMGVGLSISRTIIEAHGGHLWAENNNGGGATFRFTLPIAEEAATK